MTGMSCKWARNRHCIVLEPLTKTICKGGKLVGTLKRKKEKTKGMGPKFLLFTCTCLHKMNLKKKNEKPYKVNSTYSLK